MRVPTHTDLIVLARVLRACPNEMRDWVARRILEEADSANRCLIAENVPHPVWGDGTLASAALRRGVPPQFSLSDPEYCLCLMSVARALADGARAARTQPKIGTYLRS